MIRESTVISAVCHLPLHLISTGYGLHGDYVFGWEGDSLQRAMDHCLDDFGTPELCTELTVLSDEEINQCAQPPQVNEQVDGESAFAVK